MEINELGDVLWDKTLKWLDVASNSMLIENDIIYISGNHSTLEKWQWHQMSVDGGDSLATYDIFEEGNIYGQMFNFGQIKFGDQFCIYGSGIKNMMGESLLYFIDNNGQIDTLLHLFPTGLFAAPWRIISDNEGGLICFIEFDEPSQDDQTIIAKINDQKELTWAYFSEENWFNDAIPRGTVLEDGKVVYNTRINFNQDQNLRAINPDSTIAWQYESPNQAGKYREFRSLQTLKDGSILGLGRWGDAWSDPLIETVPWIIKISSNGEKIWEHIYYEILEGEDRTQIGAFNDAIEMEDGSFIVVGNALPTSNLPRDILIARLDSEGCLMEDCPLENDVSDILSDVNSLDKSKSITIYPNPVENILRIDSEETPSFLEVITLAGAVVKIDKPKQQLDVSALPKGMYLLKVYFNEGIEVSSFVKN
jgi:hypothetical protein